MLCKDRLNNQIYFSHIPRTGGRYVGEMLTANKICPIVNGSAYFHMKEVMHLTYQEALQYYNYKNLPNNFAVIRNPVDRFVSASKFVSGMVDFDKLDSKDYFNYFMNDYEMSWNPKNTQYTVSLKGIKNLNNNWFTSQTDFISDNTKLWKFENGLEDQFIEWVNSNICELNYKNISYDRADYDENTTVKLTEKIRDNIIDFYQQDMILWESLS